MPATIYDITIEQGATFKRIVTISDEEEQPRNLTGWEFKGQVRARYDAPQVLAEFSFEVSDQEEAKGEFTFKLSPTETSAIPADPSESYERNITRLIYDIEGTSPEGDVERFFQGEVALSPEVTREEPEEDGE